MRIEVKPSGNAEVYAKHWEDGREYVFATVFFPKKGDHAGKPFLDIESTFPVLTFEEVKILSDFMQSRQRQAAEFKG